MRIIIYVAIVTEMVRGVPLVREEQEVDIEPQINAKEYKQNEVILPTEPQITPPTEKSKEKEEINEKQREVTLPTEPQLTLPTETPVEVVSKEKDEDKVKDSSSLSLSSEEMFLVLSLFADPDDEDMMHLEEAVVRVVPIAENAVVISSEDKAESKPKDVVHLEGTAVFIRWSD